jgi:hypothetical protein
MLGRSTRYIFLGRMVQYRDKPPEKGTQPMPAIRCRDGSQEDYLVSKHHSTQDGISEVFIQMQVFT